MTDSERIQLILSRFVAADDSGDWYRDQARLIRRRARRVGVKGATYAGVVAAMSPAMTWQAKSGAYVNLDAADRVVERWQTGSRVTAGIGLGHSVRTGFAILDGADPDTVLGPKTRSFYHNLRGDHDYVTIDRWALRAAGHTRDSVSPSQYDRWANLYRSAAAIANVPPALMQAVVWEQIRKEAR